MTLAAGIGSAVGVKLKNEATRNNFRQMKTGCRLIAGPISKINRVGAFLLSNQ
jgi:hypothetical protein